MLAIIVKNENKDLDKRLNKIYRNLGCTFLYKFAIFRQQQFGISTSNFPEFYAYNQDRPSRIFK